MGFFSLMGTIFLKLIYIIFSLHKQKDLLTLN